MRAYGRGTGGGEGAGLREESGRNQQTHPNTLLPSATLTHPTHPPPIPPSPRPQVPINDTSYGSGAVSNEGWIYSLMSDIFAKWEPANGCTSSDKPSHYPTSVDGVEQLYCWGKQCGASNEYPVIRCAWKGGHNYFANSATSNSKLAWEFLSKFSRPSHTGMGVNDGSENIDYTTMEGEVDAGSAASAASVAAASGNRLLGVDGLNSTAVEEAEAEKKMMLENGTSAVAAVAAEEDSSLHRRRHYGNPFKGKGKNGCRRDESAIQFTNGNITGSACAPKMKPGTCKVGGYRTGATNGCPADLPPASPSLLSSSSSSNASMSTTCTRDADCPATSYCMNGASKSPPFTCHAPSPPSPPSEAKSFTTCLSVDDSGSTSHSVGKEFHCFVTCERTQSTNSPDPDADAMCPEGSVCLTGQLRHLHLGICMYTN